MQARDSKGRFMKKETCKCHCKKGSCGIEKGKKNGLIKDVTALTEEDIKEASTKDLLKYYDEAMKAVSDTKADTPKTGALVDNFFALLKYCSELYPIAEIGSMVAKELDARKTPFKKSKVMKEVEKVSEEAFEDNSEESDLPGTLECIRSALGIPKEEFDKILKDVTDFDVEDLEDPPDKGKCKKSCKKSCKKGSKASKMPKEILETCEELGLDPEDCESFFMMDLDTGEKHEEKFE